MKQTIKVNGVDYELDVDKAISSGAMTQHKYKIGQKYKFGNRVYILCNPAINKLCLINIKDGTRRTANSINYDRSSFHDIPRDIFVELTRNKPDEFILVQD